MENHDASGKAGEQRPVMDYRFRRRTTKRSAALRTCAKGRQQSLRVYMDFVQRSTECRVVYDELRDY